MNISFLVGGGYFTHEQLDFWKIVLSRSGALEHKIQWDDLILQRSLRIEGGILVIFGLKGLLRLLTKKAIARRHLSHYCKTFFLATVPRNIPLIVLDDLNTADSSRFQDEFFSFFYQNFNLKRYLLREYLETKRYPEVVMPFSIPCNSHSDLIVDNSLKGIDIFFQGNASSHSRAKITRSIEEYFHDSSLHLKVTGGGVRNKTDRLARPDFLKLMADSRFSLSFTGTGYDCFRYHEIASVGSIIVSPNYPLLIRNDYVDMVECVKYSTVGELRRKLKQLFNNPSLMDDMQHASVSRFNSFHTSQARAEELLDVLALAS